MRTTLSLLALLAVLAAGCAPAPEDKNADGIADSIQQTDSEGDVEEETIDIVGVAAAQTAGTDTEDPRVGIGVRTAGGPAPDSAYSNFVEVRIRYVDIPNWEISVLKQRHDGVPLTEVTGSGGAETDIDLEDVTIVPYPWGFFVEFPYPETFDRDLTIFDIFMGFLGVENGTFLEDELEDVEMEETEPVESILDEIEEVLVPA